MSRSRFALSVKRAADIIGATIGVVVLAPVFAVTSLAILAAEGRPIFFRQQRSGLHGRPFAIAKFRTMRLTRPGEIFYATDDQRITPLGRFLRSTSIDELPELWNVLRGDMSLVGPRPLLVEFLSQYTPEEQRRHDMPAGITGWAAVNGRHVLKFHDRLKLDVQYVDEWSLWLDLKIMAVTVVQVLRRTGVTETQDIKEMGFPLAHIRSSAKAGEDNEDAVGGNASGTPRGTGEP